MQSGVSQTLPERVLMWSPALHYKIMEQQQLRFPGFPGKPKENYWQYPEVMNGFWHALTPVEQKILDYILRHTWGWHKNSDYISYSQIKDGIPDIDKGIGIKSRTTLNRGLRGLERKNMIKIVSGKERGISNLYSLVLSEGVQEVDRGSIKGGQGGSPKSGHTINNTINTITINNELATTSVAGKKINDLIDLFKNVNPSYEKLFRNKTQRNALESMVKRHGFAEMIWIINVLQKTNKLPFAPIITTPLQLEDKLGNLIAFIQKEKINSQKNRIIKI